MLAVEEERGEGGQTPPLHAHDKSQDKNSVGLSNRKDRYGDLGL